MIPNFASFPDDDTRAVIDEEALSSKNREFQGKRPLGPSRAINSLGLTYGLPFAGTLTKTQIAERVATFARAAGFMKSVGFDAIEIHFGHGYGISQFISPRTNKRKDEYGGPLGNRMRFGLECLDAMYLHEIVARP